MFTATTNLIAGVSGKKLMANSGSKKASATTDDPASATRSILSTSLQLSSCIGLFAGLLLLLLSRNLILLLLGTKSTPDPQVLTSAVRYVRIRSVGIPPAVVIGSAQAACLALKDIRSPLLVLGAAAGVNLFLDAVLVGSGLKYLGGAAGAASQRAAYSRNPDH